jgi:uncharacterized circularly permuted ATP-grasp superfamily protein/uncharacterized alpha-E superfamily protein
VSLYAEKYGGGRSLVERENDGPALALAKTSPHSAPRPKPAETPLPAAVRPVPVPPDAEAQVAAWTADYAPLPGIPDEFIGPDGARRTTWMRLLTQLAKAAPGVVAERFAAADRRIRARGASYRVQGETAERVWPLGRLPLLIPMSEWRGIEAAVIQRAELIERVLADVYGPGKLIAEGALPAAALTGSPDFVAAMRGVKPPGGRWLRLYAADIGRGPDGGWWVLGDRTQAPSGAGYALENRLVVSGAFPDLYSQMNVERVAPFFRDLRAGLKKAGERTEPRICILTPGPFSATYFEHAYLARYLGFLLVEGDDLVVGEGRRAFVRTIAGLKRADVIWRQVDAEWIDPLELNSASRLGVPGLIDAIRSGGVVVENLPGTGFIESRAMLAFLPRLAERLGVGPLQMPNIATWWCGQGAERARVLENFDNVTIASAFGDSLRGLGRSVAVGAELREAERASLKAAIAARGLDYVGQEVVRLSTMPHWEGGKLAPRPFVLRVYAAATPDGWKVMPGGFARVSDKPDARAVSMGQGVESADVWVLAEKPVATASLLPNPERTHIARLLGNLPSRAADNLFWFGRYLERAEATLRLVRVLSARAVDPEAPMAGARGANENLKALLVAWGAIDAKKPVARPAEAALRSPENYGSALSIANAAGHAASVIRERLTQMTWTLIGRLKSGIADLPDRPLSEAEILDCIDEQLTTIAALSGLFDENFNRGAGWRFYELGRRIERGINTCRISRQLGHKAATEHDLDVLLDLIDSQITYRSRTLVGVALAPVRDLALLDPYNPRSVAFQTERIAEHIATLPVLRQDGIPEEPLRLATRLSAELSSEIADKLEDASILAIENRLAGLAEAIGRRYFLHGASARAEKVMGLG